MSQTKPPPSYAPVYAAAMYPELATMAREHGYALAVHGSLQRDFDLIGIPWVENPSAPEAVVTDILTKFDVHLLSPKHGNEKFHGRRAFTIVVGHGTCALDLSFMPTVIPPTHCDGQRLADSV